MRILSFFSAIWDFIRFTTSLLFIYVGSLFGYFFPPALKSLAGEIILITGSGGGIGREICLQLSKTESTLVCWDISQRDNELLVKELRRYGTRAYGYTIDVSDRSAVESTALKVKREIGHVSIVINNAGILPCHAFLSHNPREITRCFEVNLFSQFWILREFLPGMIESRKGHVVSMSSASALGGTRNLAPYAASKSAILSYMESLQAELRVHPDKPDIKFTTVFPAICGTGMLRNIKIISRFPSLLPVLEPHFVAEKVVEGFRRNYDRVYIPKSVGLIASFLTVNFSWHKAMAVTHGKKLIFLSTF